MMLFDLIDLRLFLHVVEAGSITHGATRSHLSLAAASERLRDMEQVSGTRLLERNRRGITPTRAGDSLAHHARMVMAHIDRLHGELAQFSRAMKGTIRLLANTVAANEFLPPLLASWLTAHPQVDLDLQERLSTEIAKSIAQGHAELGVLSDASDLGSLQTIPFCPDRLVLITPSAHEWAQRRIISFQEALALHFVGLSPGAPLQEHLLHRASPFGQLIRFRIRVPSFEAVCEMVSSGVGVAIVPESAARRYGRRYPLEILRLSDAWADRQLLICFRDRAELSPLAADLLTHLSRRE